MIIIIAIILIAILIIAISIAKKKSKAADYAYKTLVYIDGMACVRCKERVENIFNALPGVRAEVNLDEKYAEVLSINQLNEEEIADIVNKNGYTFVKLVQE